MEIYPKSSLTKHAFATRHLAVFPSSWSTEMHADKNCLVSLGKEENCFFFFITRHKQMMETSDCA